VPRRLDVDALVASDGGGAVLVLPDPEGPGRNASLRRALDGHPAALGPTVAPREAARSLRWARLGLELVRRGALPAERPTRTADHLADIVLLQDEDMARALVRGALGPIEGLAPPERERLLETLRAWLAHQRHTPRIAAELHVHPQNRPLPGRQAARPARRRPRDAGRALRARAGAARAAGAVPRLRVVRDRGRVGTIA
jgi:hypothetical protein